jgi:hypothetical protein
LSLLNKLVKLNIKNKAYDNFYFLLSKINNAKNLFDWAEPENKNLTLLMTHYPHSISLKVLEAIAVGNYKQIEGLYDLPIAKKNLYILKAKYKAKMYNEVIDIGNRSIKKSAYISIQSGRNNNITIQFLFIFKKTSRSIRTLCKYLSFKQQFDKKN